MVVSGWKVFELMRNGRKGSSMGTARQRWASAILCLLFAFSTVLFLSQSVPTQTLSGSAHFEAAAGGGDPCDLDDASGVQHCGTSSTCSFCAALDADLPELDGTSASSLVIAEMHAVGRETRPHFQPPRLPLQA